MKLYEVTVGAYANFITTSRDKAQKFVDAFNEITNNDLLQAFIHELDTDELDADADKTIAEFKIYQHVSAWQFKDGEIEFDVFREMTNYPKNEIYIANDFDGEYDIELYFDADVTVDKNLVTDTIAMAKTKWQTDSYYKDLGHYTWEGSL